MTDCITTPCIVTQPVTDRAGIFFDVRSVFFFSPSHHQCGKETGQLSWECWLIMQAESVLEK